MFRHSVKSIQNDVMCVLYSDTAVRLCRFECPPGNGRWARTNVIHDDFNIVFDRTSVIIHQESRDAVTADPNQVVFYNEGTQYRREMVDPSGDSANVLLFDGPTVQDVVAQYDPSVHDRPLTPFRFANGPVAHSDWMQQQCLFRHVGSGDPTDDAWVVESSLQLLDRVVSSAYRVRSLARLPRRAQTDRRRREATEHVKTILAERFRQGVRLSELADAVDLSIFHLSRTFREITGVPIYRYLLQLRLKWAWLALQNTRTPIAAVALDAGFCSQSHFARALRAEFGVTPWQVRCEPKHGRRDFHGIKPT